MLFYLITKTLTYSSATYADIFTWYLKVDLRVIKRTKNFLRTMPNILCNIYIYIYEANIHKYHHWYINSKYAWYI